MFKKIQTALFFSFLLSAFAALAAFMLLAMPRIQETSVKHIETELFKQISLSQSDLAPLLEGKNSRAEIQSKVIRASEASKSRVTLISNNGTVLADTATPLSKLSQLDDHSGRPEIVQAEIEGQGLSKRYSTTAGDDLIYAAAAIRDEKGNVLGYLRFSVSTAYASEIVSNIRRSMAGAALLATLAAVLLAALFSFLFARPIVRLSLTAKKIAEGEFPQRILRRSRFEIGELEGNIEDMSVKLAELFSRLSMEKNRARAILSSMAEGVIAVDREGRTTLVNPSLEKLFGVIEPEVIGRPYRETIRNNDIAGLIEEALRRDHKTGKEISIVSPIEASFTAYAAPLKDGKDNVIGAICVLYDISELKKLENYRSDFVANVSHELKTPLTAIRGLVESLLSGAMDEKERRVDFLRKIEKHSINLASLIDDILEISKLESGSHIGPFSKVDLNEVACHAVETISQKARKKGISIEIEECSGPLFISGIEEHVYRAILNLLDNAVNYSDKGGKIAVSVRKEADSIALSVRDNGTGISSEHLDRIFERFYRADAARSREHGGTGLGLSIVKHVMNIHGGTVAAASEPEKGSVFTLVFPSFA